MNSLFILGTVGLPHAGVAPAQKIIVRPNIVDRDLLRPLYCKCKTWTIFGETTKSLKICYIFNINQERVYRIKISDVDELKRRINSHVDGSESHGYWMCCRAGQ